MDSKEIADRLDGMKRGNLQLDLFKGELWLTIRNKHRGVDIFVDGEVSPSDLLAFCRAVVEKIDGIKVGMVEEAASCAGMGTTKEELERKQNEMSKMR